MVMGSSHFLYSSSQDFLENIQEDIPLLFLSTYERYLCILIIFQRGMFGTSTDIESIYQKHLRGFRTLA